VIQEQKKDFIKYQEMIDTYEEQGWQRKQAESPASRRHLTNI
jgi:hypothetical protein